MRILKWLFGEPVVINRSVLAELEVEFTRARVRRDAAELRAEVIMNRCTAAEGYEQLYRDRLNELHVTLALIDSLLSAGKLAEAQMMLRPALVRATRDGARPRGGFHERK